MTQSPLQPLLAGRYRLERELGRGGMATVWLAEDLRHGRRVAVKVFRPELSASVGAQRFTQEIALTASLQHANILPLFDSGEAGGQLYFVMPFVDGETLRERQQRGSVPAAESLSILHDVARALAYAHHRGIVHRDVKPENVLLAAGTAYVADFGIAKAIHVSRTNVPETLTAPGSALGTPAYMAPEQVLGDAIDERTDVYAWGVVAYELLTGRHPFAGKTSAQSLVAAHVSEAPASVPARHGLPVEVTQIVMKALAKAPADRPATGAALLEALDHALTPGEHSGATATHTEVAPVARRDAIWLGAAALVVVGALAFATMHGTRGSAGLPIRRAATSDSATPTIAVLPFTNIGSAPENAIFADGMTDDVIARLSVAGGLTVISRASSMTYKGSTKSLKQIAAELGVNAVLEGSVRRAGSRVRVVAQLVDPRTEANRWAGTFDRELADVFTIQSEVAQSIADTLHAALHPDERRRMAALPTRDTLAYQYFLQGRASASRRTPANVWRAVALYDSAVRLDSSFALAYAQQALELAVIPNLDTIAPRPIYARARHAAARAIAIEPTLAEARSVLGLLHILDDYDWTAAERELTQARTGGSGSSMVHRHLSMLMCALRRDSAAAAEAMEAVRLDPRSQPALQSVGSYLLCAHRIPDALTMARRAAAIDSGNRVVWSNIASIGWLTGDVEEVIAATNLMARAEGSVGVDPVRARAAAKAGGLPGLARFMAAEYHSPQAYRQQLVYKTVMGDRDGVFLDLQRRYERRDPQMVWILRMPLLDSWHGDPRYVAFLRKMKLEP